MSVHQGVKRIKTRWKKCVNYLNDEMGLAVGAMFVRDNFRRQSKETVHRWFGDLVVTAVAMMMAAAAVVVVVVVVVSMVVVAA